MGSYKNTINGGSSGYSYEYDALGNITGMGKSTGALGAPMLHVDSSDRGQVYRYYYHTYQYDNLNRLIRENDYDRGKTITYTYDTGGNLLQVKEHAYTYPHLTPASPTSTITYGYNSTNGWKDQLTSFGG